ncbi:MAG: GNAT family N-acetyltransferase, partial [Chloroflexota bacterium]|nr:GNAT family N-acetyltransferase [Chloroflexota bacterium]
VNMGPSRNHLRVLIRNVVREGRVLLGAEESKKFLTTYGIPSATSYVAGNPDEAVRIASLLGYPVVMKINSPDVSHKSDVGGVILNVPSASEVKKVFTELIANVKGYLPDARIEGVSVQRMVTNYNYELVIRSQKDPVFGPVIMLGQEGMREEFFKGVAAGLPPLNQVLARMLVEQTRVYKLLSQRSGARPVASLRLLEEALVGVSNLISDFPEIKELDINPLALSTTSIGVLDAKIVLDECAMRGEVGEYAHLIISPYPTRYVQPWTCKDGRQVLLRPVRPEDEPLEKELLSGLSEEASRLRFFYRLKHITHEMLIRFCNIDYDVEMAIIAEYTSAGKKRSVGDGRLVVASGGEEGEIAVLVADDFQNNGLGIKISDMLVGIAQEKGLKCIYGIVLNDNSKMLGLFRKLGFTIEKISPEESKASLEF